MPYAEGASTISKVFTAKPGWGGEKKAYFTITFNGNYNTGGYDCDLTAYGLGTIRMVNLPPCKAGLIPEYDATNKKLKFYYADYDAGADGALIEVADGASTLTSSSMQFSVEGVGV